MSVLIMPCEMLFRARLVNASSIVLIGIVRGIIIGLGVHFDNCGSLRDSFQGLLISLGRHHFGPLWP